MMTSNRCLIVLVAMCALLGTARGDTKRQARAHVDAADRAYKLGKFETALDEYTRAYELYPAPALLFNVAQCHRNLKQFERAIFFYEGFLRDSPHDAPNRALVQDLIRETRIELDKQTAEDAAARRAEAAREQLAIEAARIEAERDARRWQERERAVAEARRQAELERQRRPKSRGGPIYTKWWLWSAIGATLAAGGTLYYLSGDTTYVPPSGSLGGLDRR